MFCPKCGKKAEDNANFCDSCGYNLTNDLSRKEERLTTVEEKNEEQAQIIEEKKEEQIEEKGIRERMELEGRLNSGADWFIWIAVLSLINSIVMLSGNEWGFLIGLGITQIIDAVVGSGAAFILDVIVACVFIAFGIYAKKRYNGVFIAGMILYGLDGLLFLSVSEYLSFGFHIFALFGIYGGLSASMQMDKMGM